MSTSPRRALAEPNAGETFAAVGLKAFPYDMVSPAAPAMAGPAAKDLSPARAESDFAVREAKARAEGHRAGEEAAQKVFEEKLARERSSLAVALKQFTADRAVYFQKLEGEVVQLALSIARKILYREAQIDPLLLAGIVRVALEKMDRETGVVLRIHPQNAADWRVYLSTQLDSADRPEISEDPSQAIDSCTLETAMGTAAFGLDIQLKEIERGLMDLLAARPGTSS